MQTVSKCKWSKVLKSAILIMNSTSKRSTKYTPFNLMFNRESNHIGLLEYLHQNNFKSEYVADDSDDMADNQ